MFDPGTQSVLRSSTGVLPSHAGEYRPFRGDERTMVAPARCPGPAPAQARLPEGERRGGENTEDLATQKSQEFAELLFLFGDHAGAEGGSTGDVSDTVA